MKLLFDQNLSPHLVLLLADLFPNSAHVDALGLGKAIDTIAALISFNYLAIQALVSDPTRGIVTLY